MLVHSNYGNMKLSLFIKKWSTEFGTHVRELKKILQKRRREEKRDVAGNFSLYLNTYNL